MASINSLGKPPNYTELLALQSNNLAKCTHNSGVKTSSLSLTFITGDIYYLIPQTSDGFNADNAEKLTICKYIHCTTFQEKFPRLAWMSVKAPHRKFLRWILLIAPWLNWWSCGRGLATLTSFRCFPRLPDSIASMRSNHAHLVTVTVFARMRYI